MAIMPQMSTRPRRMLNQFNGDFEQVVIAQKVEDV